MLNIVYLEVTGIAIMMVNYVLHVHTQSNHRKCVVSVAYINDHNLFKLQRGETISAA